MYLDAWFYQIFFAQIPQSYEVDRDIIEILLGLSNQLPATHTSNRSNGPTDRRRHWTRNTPDARRSDRYGNLIR